MRLHDIVLQWDVKHETHRITYYKSMRRSKHNQKNQFLYIAPCTHGCPTKHAVVTRWVDVTRYFLWSRARQLSRSSMAMVISQLRPQWNKRMLCSLKKLPYLRRSTWVSCCGWCFCLFPSFSLRSCKWCFHLPHTLTTQMSLPEYTASKLKYAHIFDDVILHELLPEIRVEYKCRVAGWSADHPRHSETWPERCRKVPKSYPGNHEDQHFFLSTWPVGKGGALE